jgi:hypothetical protein
MRASAKVPGLFLVRSGVGDGELRLREKSRPDYLAHYGKQAQSPGSDRQRNSKDMGRRGSDGDPLRRSLSRAFCFSSVDRVTAEARGGNFERSCRKVGQEKSKIDGQ